MRSPFSPFRLLLLIFAISFLIVFIQVGVLTLAFDKLNLSAGSAMTLLIASLFGSVVNVPLFTINAGQPPEHTMERPFRGLLHLPPPMPFTGKTVIAVNLGGCLIPLTFSLYLILNRGIPVGEVLIATLITTTASYFFSRPVPGMGIGMPVFVAPILAALTAMFINPEQSPALAYICGTLGVIIGADILRLSDIRKMGTPVASIGGAGTFDGIFITGIIAVLLA